MGTHQVHSWTILLICVGLLSNTFSLGQGQSSNSTAVSQSDPERLPENAKEIVVNSTLEYRSDNGGYFFAPIEISSLEGGKKYKLKIIAYNPTDQIIEFSKVVTDCSCAKFEASADKILPHNSAIFYMQIDAPTIGAESKVSTTAQFVGIDTKRTVLRFQVQYSLNRVFSLPSNRFTIEVPDNLEIVNERIPIYLVAPLSIHDLELQIGESLRDFSTEFVVFDGKPYISISVPKLAVANGGVLGELAIKTRGADKAWSLLVEVRRQQRIQVTPESLRFTPGKDDNTRYEATALVRVKVPPKNVEKNNIDGKANETPVVVPLPEVSVLVNDEPAEVIVKRLGGAGLFRVTVQIECESTVEFREDTKIKWLIQHSGEERVILSTAFFSKLL
jgi:hypothetical protein